MRKRRVFTMRSNCVLGVTNRRNRLGTLKHCAIAHKNGQNMRKRRVFTMHSNRILGVTNRGNRPGTLKLSKENGQNMRKRRVLMMRSNLVLGVTTRQNWPGTLKLCASPQIMPKYAKITSFDDALKSCIGGSQTVEIGP
jgi:hypothetical protein